MVTPDESWSESHKILRSLCSLLHLNLHLRLLMSAPSLTQLRGWLYIEISYFWTDFGKITKIGCKVYAGITKLIPTCISPLLPFPKHKANIGLSLWAKRKIAKIKKNH